MKRKKDLYKNTYKLENIFTAYNEVMKNTKNKKKVEEYKKLKCAHIFNIYNTLKNKEYHPGKYNIFTIYEPKKRIIVSQEIEDKIINHIVTRYILEPAVFPCLLDCNVASRKNMGVSKGIELANKYKRKCNIKYKKYYILKCDISKFFASINHNILKIKLSKKIKDKDALEILYIIIDSYKDGIGIGNMTSQIFAIFYLNDLDHYIKEELKIKYYIRYQDDFLLFHSSKKYLKFCLNKIEEFLKNEKLMLNKKTRIYTNKNNFIFLGKTKNGKYAKYRTINKKIKKRIQEYKNNKIRLISLISSINNLKINNKK